VKIFFSSLMQLQVKLSPVQKESLWGGSGRGFLFCVAFFGAISPILTSTATHFLFTTSPLLLELSYSPPTTTTTPFLMFLSCC
jgi:hypothetical protein